MTSPSNVILTVSPTLTYFDTPVTLVFLSSSNLYDVDESIATSMDFSVNSVTVPLTTVFSGTLSASFETLMTDAYGYSFRSPMYTRATSSPLLSSPLISVSSLMVKDTVRLLPVTVTALSVTSTTCPLNVRSFCTCSRKMILSAVMVSPDEWYSTSTTSSRFSSSMPPRS